MTDNPLLTLAITTCTASAGAWLSWKIAGLANSAGEDRRVLAEGFWFVVLSFTTMITAASIWIGLGYGVILPFGELIKVVRSTPLSVLVGIAAALLITTQWVGSRIRTMYAPTMVLPPWPEDDQDT